MIHFNTAGAGVTETSVVDRMKAYFELERRVGSYEAEMYYDKMLSKDIYAQLESVFNGKADNFALFDSSTRAWATVLGALPIRSASEIWVTPYEYAGFLVTLHNLAKKSDANLRFIPIDEGGNLDLDWMAQNISNDVSIVSIPHVPSGCGIVNPVEEIGEIISGFEAFYFVDACQSVGQIEVDCSRIGADLITGAGRKFICGPRGTGFLHISYRLLKAVHPISSDLHACDIDSNMEPFYTTSSARRLELSEKNNAVFVGFYESLRLLQEREEELARPSEAFLKLRGELLSINDINCIAPGEVNSGILSFSHKKYTIDFLIRYLHSHGFNVWRIKGSHTPRYMLERGVEEAIRVSVSHKNTVAECEDLASKLKQISR